MNYWRHPGKMSVGTNWAAFRVPGLVIFGVIFWLLPVPFSRFAPYGSWLFWVSISFWGGLSVLCIVLLIVKWCAKKAAAAKSSGSPDTP
jgi:protein-S-isoprenylcysteine O-methyltransferase Ste14